MISKKMKQSLNDQINKEMYSAYLYLAMSADTTHRGLDGFANWFMVQYQEEMEHATRIYNYINDQGGKVELQAIEQQLPALQFLARSDEQAKQELRT